MPEPTNIIFSYKEIVELFIKSQGIHEGIWGLFVRFGLSAANIGESEQLERPAAIVPVLDIGLQKMERESNLAVDASKVNPGPRPAEVPPTLTH
jgi:hypothetical protein